MKIRKIIIGMLRDIGVPMLVGLSVTFGVQHWIVSAAEVPSASMYPTIPNPCHILVNRLATEFSTPYRGEVVLFHFPDNPSQIFVKRIIGLPGDTVKITDMDVYINGRLMREPYIKLDNRTGLGTYKVPVGHYFMLGDNRPISDDSRFWIHHYVERSAIIGKAEYVLFPFSKCHKIN